jgi:crooked neck
MVFADDERESNPTSFKFLQMAHAWKKNQAAGGAHASSKPSVLSGFAAATETSKTTIDAEREG